MDLTNEHWDDFVAHPTSCEWIVYGPLIAGCLSTQKKMRGRKLLTKGI